MQLRRPAAPVVAGLVPTIGAGVKLYFDFNDWWVGVYRGPNHWYLIGIPTLVLRIPRRKR